MRCAWPKPVRTCRFPTLHAEPAEVFSLRRCALGSAILVLIAALRIVSTYTVLSTHIDEPIHLGAGMEWLDHGTITGDASHPPLARALSAIGPYLAGERWIPAGNSFLDGMAILGRDAHYDRILALARLGILPLFLLACAIDRKSTRLNSSHLGISYAVFCLENNTHELQS